ncbi:MAG TPA: ATP-binding protein [Candidatus Dormibacteraeota bacterium]|jgi:heavy metal sensor kinase
MREFVRRTRVRLTLMFILLVLAVAGVAAAGFWTSYSQYEYATIDGSLRSQADVVRSIIAQTPPASSLPLLPPGNPRGVAMDSIVVSSAGVLVGKDQADLDTQALVAFARQQAFPPHAAVQSATVRGLAVRVLLRQVTLPDQTSGGLVVVRPIDELLARLTRVALLLVGGVVGLVGVAGLLAWRLAGLALAPVRTMSAAARDISEHDLKRRLHSDLPADDELGELAFTFNEMLSRLDQTFDSLQRFTADAAHELRAPLAVMRSQVEVTLRHPRTLAQYRSSHLTLLQEIERLSRIADQLLMLARVDTGALHNSFREFDLADLLEETTGRWRPVAKEQGVALGSAIPSEGRMMADEDLMARLLDNLLDNAIRHTPKGGEVRLEASRSGRDWRITVTDTGPGIQDEVRRHLFERFFRGDSVRGRTTGGAGLGLSLSLAIARLHGGTIEVADRGPLPGACFVVQMPNAG